MFKARVQTSDALRWDPRFPYHVDTTTESDPDHNLLLNVVIDPILATKLRADRLEVQVLRKAVANPGILDNVQSSTDIVSNVKSIFERSQASSEEFISDNLVSETLGTDFATIALPIATAFFVNQNIGETIDPTNLPTYQIVVTESALSDSEKATATLIPKTGNFENADLEYFFPDDVRSELIIDSSGLKLFTEEAFNLGRSTTGVGLFPFPIDSGISEAANIHRSGLGDSIVLGSNILVSWAGSSRGDQAGMSSEMQALGLDYLTDVDWLPSTFAVPAVIADEFVQFSDMSGEEVSKIQIDPENEVVTDTGTSLGTAYAQLVAYDENLGEDLYVVERAMRYFPYPIFATIPEIEGNQEATGLYLVKVRLINDLGLEVSSLEVEVDVNKSNVDSKRAKLPPIISYSLPADQTELGTTTITIANSDPNNSIVHLFSKTGMNSTYSMLGSYDIPAGEAEIIEDVVVDTLERTVFRAVVGSSSNSQAFSDVIYSPGTFVGLANAGINILVSPSIDPADGSTQVTVQTFPSGTGGSAWDKITIKRLTLADPIEGGWVIAEGVSVISTVIDTGDSPNSAAQQDNPPTPGETYTYSVDGYTSDGVEYGVGTVEFTVPVDETGVVITVDDLSGPTINNRTGNLTFNALGTVSVPDGFDAAITLSKTSILITTSNLEQYQFTPSNFMITEDGIYGFELLLQVSDTDDVTIINDLTSVGTASVSLVFSIATSELASEESSGTVTWIIPGQIPPPPQPDGQGPPVNNAGSRK